MHKSRHAADLNYKNNNFLITLNTFHFLLIGYYFDVLVANCDVPDFKQI